MSRNTKIVVGIIAGILGVCCIIVDYRGAGAAPHV
jgi:hypothetical protein